jgi:hypothetical protein
MSFLCLRRQPAYWASGQHESEKDIQTRGETQLSHRAQHEHGLGFRFLEHSPLAAGTILTERAASSKQGRGSSHNNVESLERRTDVSSTDEHCGRLRCVTITLQWKPTPLLGSTHSKLSGSSQRNTIRCRAIRMCCIHSTTGPEGYIHLRPRSRRTSRDLYLHGLSACSRRQDPSLQSQTHKLPRVL